MSDVSALHEAIRKEAKPGLWSVGVKLARGGAVVEESRTATTVTLRVKPPNRTVPFEVVLHPKDAVWECNCPAHFDPCEHVCAAGIALHLAESQGGALTSAAKAWARVGYRFATTPTGLSLSRVLLRADGTDAPLPSLKALLADADAKAQLQVEDHDLTLERMLDRPLPTPIPTERLLPMLAALEPARTVTIDGRPVSVSSEAVPPLVRVEDDGDGFAVTITADERVTAVLSDELALLGDVVCRLSETALTGPRLQALPQRKRYAPEQKAELSAKVLPELARRCTLDVRTRRVPPIDKSLTPRAQLELNQVEGGLSVLPTLVYGAPPHVRIDAGKVVYLRGAVPLRDEPAEQRVVHALRDQLDLVPGRRMTVGTAELPRFLSKLSRWQGGITGDGARRLSNEASLVPRLDVRSLSEGGVAQLEATLTFDVKGVPGGPASVDAAAVLRAWSEGLGLVPLAGGGWAPLPTAWLDVHGQRVADLLAARQESGRIATHAVPRLLELCEALEAPKPPGFERLAPLVDGFERLPEPTLPADVTATLRPYQRQGVGWLQFLRRAGLGGVLADDMGLGKTLQAICALEGQTLVVCPTSVLPNWLAELRRFRPSLKAAAYHGPNRALADDAQVTVTTYALLRLDEAALTAKPWDTVVLDEAQAIKNADSQTARAAFKLQARFRVALSGTPVENRLDELWSVMHFANPGLLRGKSDFKATWAEPIADGKADAAQALRRRIKPFVLRRLKKDVAPELPPRTESVLYVQLDDKERALYDAVYAATRADVVAQLGQGASVLQVLEALLRLRQAACHAGLLPGQVAASSSKVDALVDALVTARDEGHKALVFSQWTSLLDLIEPKLKAQGLGFVRLDGSTPDRGAVTARFQADDGPPVMLLSLKAGGVGLNLTAADHVFLVDPWWNPAVEAQATDRAHRIGQDKPVNVYRLVSQGTVEERILALQDKKRALFEAAFGDGAAATGLSRDDLLELLA